MATWKRVGSEWVTETNGGIGTVRKDSNGRWFEYEVVARDGSALVAYPGSNPVVPRMGLLTKRDAMMMAEMQLAKVAD